MQDSNEQASIAILGGGPAGLFAAIGLRNQGFAVTVFEKNRFTDYCVGEHLLPDTLPILHELGIPATVWNSCSDPCFEVEFAWGTSQFDSAHSLSNPFGSGLLLYRPEFDRALGAYARVRGVELVTGARVRDLQQINGTWIVRYLEDDRQKTAHADFVIDASGKNSRFTTAFDVKKYNYDNLTAFTWYCQPDAHHRPRPGKLQVEAAENGWWYSTLVRNDLMIVSFMTDADIAAATGIVSAELTELVEAAAGIRQAVQHSQHISEVIAVSARTRCLSRLAGDNWLATGDAAWSMDPLSSQGIYKAARTGLDAANAIGLHCAGHDDALANYNRIYLDMFMRNLDVRGQYYRLEQRWPGSTFWQRRHKPGWTEIPLTMDPATPIETGDNEYRHLFAELKTLTPAIDRDLLAHAMSSSLTALEAVDRYKTLSSHEVQDREIIVAVQHLLYPDDIRNPGPDSRNTEPRNTESRNAESWYTESRYTESRITKH